VNIPLLYKEKTFTNHQFPTVTALNDPPTQYEGMLRCEKGEVKTDTAYYKKRWTTSDGRFLYTDDELLDPNKVRPQ
jgi:hypothetical protein